MTDTLTTGLSSSFARRDSNFLTPPRSPRQPPISPPPSLSLLKLQKLGLELGPSRSSQSLHAPSYNSSIRTTPSDLDKPLPLEPPEIDKRASSVYSVETTISNIIDLYSGATPHVERESSVPNAHRSQAYRDTVAPLMARRYSGAESPPPLPLFFKRMSGAESPPPLLGVPGEDGAFPLPMPSPSIYQDFSPPMSPDFPDVPALPVSARVPSPSIYPESPLLSPHNSKHGAPSYADSARNLPQKRPEVVSPISSAGSEDYHRQLAMDSLAPPSPRDSPDVRPVAFEGSDMFLPGPMSGTITHVVAPDMVPPPLDLNRTSRRLSPQEAERRKYDSNSKNSSEDFLAQSAQQGSSVESSLDIFNHSPSHTPDLSSVEKQDSQRFTAEEQYRILSYASEKYPGMKSPAVTSKVRTSKRSSLSQRASSLMRAISTRKGSADTGVTRTTADTAPEAAEYVPGGRKKLAIQPTSYQLYGEAAWEKDEEGKQKQKKKRRRKDQRGSKGSSRSQQEDDDVEPKMGFLEGARHKLTRTASEKRREKLKNSIKLVGPTEITKERHAREDPRKWWE